MTLFHGTQATLEPGDVLSPEGAATFGHRDHLSPDYVFATEHLELAKQYAHGSPGGATRPCYVYEVAPAGDIEQDPADVAGSYRSRQPMRVVRLVATRPVARRDSGSGWAPLMHGPWH